MESLLHGDGCQRMVAAINRQLWPPGTNGSAAVVVVVCVCVGGGGEVVSCQD